MKSVIIHADGRHIDLAAAVDPDIYAELENTRSPHHLPVLRCGGCGGGISVKHGIVYKDELFGYHHQAGTCTETLVIRKSVMSDEHKREAEYHARAAERAGHVADFEVVTAGHTRVDVVVDGRVGFEIQRSVLSKAAAVDRTARSVRAGLGMIACSKDSNRVGPRLSQQETDCVHLNALWVTAQVLGYLDPNLDVYEFAEAAGVNTLTSRGERSGHIIYGLRQVDGRYCRPGTWDPPTSDF